MAGGGPSRDRILHIADLHFWRVVTNPLRLLNKRFLGNLNVLIRRRREFPMGRAESFIPGLTSTGIPTAVLTGDFTSTSTEEEFRLARRFVDALSRSGVTLRLLPGNHDVYTFEAQRNRRFERHFPEFVPVGGGPWREDLAGGTPLVLVPTVCPNILTSRGRVTGETVAAVSRLLRQCTGPVLVAGHYPVLHRTREYRLGLSRRLGNAEALRDALGASGQRILYLAGHVHRFSYMRDPKYGNLDHLTTGAFFRENRREEIGGEFAEVHIREDGFDVFRHTYRGMWSHSEVAVDTGRSGL